MSQIKEVGAVTMRIYFGDIDPVAECECGWESHGDSINDAVSAWGRHVTEKHREDL